METRKLPINLAPEDVNIFSADLSYFIPNRQIRVIKNCVILKYGGVMKNFQLIEESLGDIDKHKHHYSFKFFLKSFLQFPRKFFFSRSVILVYDLWSGNIFHWLNDVLPRIFLVRHLIPNHTFIFPATFKESDYVLFTLQKLGIKNICWIEEESFVFVHRLVLPHHIAYSGNYDVNLSHQVSKFLLSFRSDVSFGERIYISRGNASTRRIVNEGDVLRCVSAFGFRMVKLEEYSFADQMAISAQSKILISPHGAGLTHIMFMEPRSRVLELRTAGKPQNNCYFNLADAFQLEYYYLICRADSDKNDFQNDNMFVDIGNLQKVIIQMLHETQ